MAYRVSVRIVFQAVGTGCTVNVLEASVQLLGRSTLLLCCLCATSCALEAYEEVLIDNGTCVLNNLG